jgi:hypothetical protein
MPRPQRRKARLLSTRRGRTAVERFDPERGAARPAHRDEREIRERIRDIARRMPDPERIVGAGVKHDAILLPNIMTLWHEDPKYRDTLSRPARLKLRARGPCLAQLIRRVWPRGDVRLIARALVRSGAVRRRGAWYEPNGRFVSFREAPPAALAHTLMSVRGLLRTIEHNLATRDAHDALLERHAINSHIPVAALPTVHRYFKREVANLLGRADAYLKRWEVPPGSEPTVLVGLATFAYEDSNTPGAAATTRRRNSR